MHTHLRAAIPAALCVGLLGLGTPVQAQGPSFSCDAASNAGERMICSDPALAREDVLLARLYAVARRAAPLGNPGNGHVAAQRRWLTQRAQCDRRGAASTAELRECLRLAYESRIVELATAALYTDRELALTVLRQREPDNAALVEALLLQASHPEGSDWTAAARRADRERIRALIGGRLQRFLRTPDNEIAAYLLSDAQVNSVDDALGSDERFTLTIKVLAVEGESPLRIPCEVIVRRPDLQALEDPVFGSNRDNFLPRTDCAEALPPAPRLQALDAAVWRGWPACEGSIRSAAYGSYAVRLNEARLGMPMATTAVSRSMPRRAGVSPQVVEAAIAELTTRYSTYRGYPPETARNTAYARIVALLEEAHGCGGEGD